VSFFQSEKYYNLLKGLPHIEPFIFRPHNSNGDLVNLITGIHYNYISAIKRLFASRIVIIGEPASATKLQSNIDWQFRKQTKWNNSIYTELRLIEPPKNLNFIAQLPYSFVSNYMNILVDTTLSPEKLFSNLSNSKKRQVSSSLNAGAVVRPAQSEEEVKDFYKITNELYKKKIKKPLIPQEVFLRIFRDKSLGEVLLVYFDNKVVGGMLCPFYEKDEIYEWYIASLDLEMKTYKVYPSVLVTWEVIKYASENGFRQFNFMGAGKQSNYYGVREFKMQFGGKLVEAPRYFFIHKPLLYKLGKFAIRMGLGYRFI